MDYRQYRAIYLACCAAVPPNWSLGTLPVLADGAFLLASFFVLIFALSGYLNGWAILMGLATGTFIRRAHAPFARHQRVLDAAVESFAERFAAALAPPPPASPPVLSEFSPTDAAQLICNACRRAAARECHRLARRLNSLATVSVAAPFFGVLGTSICIIASFKGVAGERSHILATVANNLADSFIPTAWSLAIAILAYATRRALHSQLQSLKHQMESMSLALANALRR